MSVIASIINKYLEASIGDAETLNKEFTRLEAATRDIGSRISYGGKVTTLSVNNIEMSASTGLRVINPSTGQITMDLQSDGDVFIGHNISELINPDLAGDVFGLSLAVFSNDQTFQGEDLGQGDLLIGDNTATNAFYDASAGRLNFRYGSNTYAYIGADGKIYSLAGEIGGWTISSTQIKKTGIILDSANDKITVGASGTKINIDGASHTIASSDFTSGVRGFQIDAINGNAEFNNVLVRGELHSTVFVKGLIEARAGTTLWGKSSGSLSSIMTVPASGTWTMTLKDPPGGAAFLFDNTDICTVKGESLSGSIIQTWFTVSGRTDNGDGTQTYTCTYASGSRPVTSYAAGNPVVDYGASGQGLISISADGSIGSSANLSIFTHAGAPWTTTTLLTRLGNMNGAYDTGAHDYYGIGLGDYSSGDFMRYNDTDGFLLSAGGSAITIDASGITSFVDTTATNQAEIKFNRSTTKIARTSVYGTSGLTNAYTEIVENTGDAQYFFGANAPSGKYAYAQLIATGDGGSKTSSVKVQGHPTAGYTTVTIDADDTIELLADTNVSAALGVTGNINNGQVWQGTASIADDNASIIYPINTSGILLIGRRSGSAGCWAIVNFRATATPYTTLMAGAATVDVTTGQLTGTTGTDTHFTISTHTDGYIYVENRLGGTCAISYTLLGS